MGVGGEIGTVDQHDIGAERRELGTDIVAAHDIDGTDAALLRQRDQVAADRRIGDVLDDPVAGLQRDVVFQQQQCGRRIDAQHRRLRDVQAGRERDRVLGLDAAALRPVLALHVDDELARLHMRHARSDRHDPADAFGARGRRQRRPQPVIAAAQRQIGRVDRKRQDVEHDLARAGPADIRRLNAMRDLFRRAVGGDLDLLHGILMGFPGATLNSKQGWPTRAITPACAVGRVSGSSSPSCC